MSRYKYLGHKTQTPANMTIKMFTFFPLFAGHSEEVSLIKTSCGNDKVGNRIFRAVTDGMGTDAKNLCGFEKIASNGVCGTKILLLNDLDQDLRSPY